MKDISLHLLDVLENAANAGSPTASVWLRCEGNMLVFELQDEGPGLPREIAEDPTDPYRTTRTERPVGLGLALLRAAAEQSGGSLEVRSVPNQGVAITASFDMSSVDAKPLGDIGGALLTAVIGWPMELRVQVGEGRECILDTAAVRAALDDVPLSHPRVRRYLECTLSEGLAGVLDHVEQVFESAAGTGRAMSFEHDAGHKSERH